MSDDEFEIVGSGEVTVTPPSTMRIGEQITVTDRDGNVRNRFTATLVPVEVGNVKVGDRVEYTDTNGRHVLGTVLHSHVDPVTGLDVISIEEGLIP